MTTTERTNYGVKEIAKLFPTLMKIKQKSLREKVAAVWNEAIITGCGGKGLDLRRTSRGQVLLARWRHRHDVRRASQFLRAAMHRHRGCAGEIVPLRHSHSARLSHRRGAPC